MKNNGSKELPSGFKINRLTVIELHHKDKRWRRHYLCKCDCGIEKVVQGSLLLSGNTKSCGCLNQEIKRTLHLLPNNLGIIRQIILGYKRHAKRRGLLFLLSEQEVIELISKPCYYCKAIPNNNKVTKNGKSFLYNGIDRVDSSKNYYKDNVVPCCNKCNKSKMAMSKEDFLSWIEKVYTHSIKNVMADQWG